MNLRPVAWQMAGMPRLIVSALLAATFALSPAGYAAAPPPAYGGLPASYSFARLARLAGAAPVVIAATIRSALPLKDVAGLEAGRARFYIEADVNALIAGNAALPATITYLVDLAIPPSQGRKRLKGVPVLLLAAPTETPGALRLIAPDAQLPRTPENETRLRTILTASLARDAPPAIEGITRAFHVAGSLPGESETQIFLKTADARPISLTILRRPGEAPRWAVSLTEMVDNSAAPPKPDSLLWYRLACGLPPSLPDTALAGLEEDNAAAARADYGVVLMGLGPCNAN